MRQISEIRRIGELAPEFSTSTLIYLSPLGFCVASINTVNKNPLSSKSTPYNKGQGPQALTRMTHNKTLGLKFSALESF